MVGYRMTEAEADQSRGILNVHLAPGGDHHVAAIHAERLVSHFTAVAAFYTRNARQPRAATKRANAEAAAARYAAILAAL